MLLVDHSILIIKSCLTGVCVGVSQWECVNKSLTGVCVGVCQECMNRSVSVTV
jgi:hypothetical protein